MEAGHTGKSPLNKNSFVERSSSGWGPVRVPLSPPNIMSIKAYKYRMYANTGTTEKLQWVLDRCRELYNAALTERRDAYEMHVKRHPGYYDEETRKRLTRELPIDYYGQKRDLVEIKDLRPEYQGIASHVLQDVLLRLKRAFDGFFRRVQHGEQPGLPTHSRQSPL